MSKKENSRVSLIHGSFTGGGWAWLGVACHTRFRAGSKWFLRSQVKLMEEQIWHKSGSGTISLESKKYGFSMALVEDILVEVVDCVVALKSDVRGRKGGKCRGFVNLLDI